MFLSRNPPRFGDQPAAKTKIPTFLQLFCDCGLFSISKKRNRTAVQQITWAFASQSAIGNLQTIPNRKKVALRADFLFFELSGTAPRRVRSRPERATMQAGTSRLSPNGALGAGLRTGGTRWPRAVPRGGPQRHRKSSPLQRCKKKARASNLGCPRFVFKRYSAYFRTQVPSGDRIPRPCA